MIRCVLLACCALLVTQPEAACAAGVDIQLPAHASPGQPLVAAIASDTPLNDVFVEWNGRSVPVRMQPDGAGWRGLALLGVPYDQKGQDVSLRVSTVSAGGYNVYRRTVPLQAMAYPEQRLTVDRKYVELAKKDLDRHQGERKHVLAALGTMSARHDWRVPLLRPVPGEISSAYGLTRFFNDKPRNPHKGLDLRGAAGTPVMACADGVVVLAEQHFFAGNSVYIDHGEGVVSMYFHMSKINVKKGDRVVRGQRIGAVGMTGRVTGPHLHFGLSAQGELIDPTPLLADK